MFHFDESHYKNATRNPQFLDDATVWAFEYNAQLERPYLALVASAGEPRRAAFFWGRGGAECR